MFITNTLIIGAKGSGKSCLGYTLLSKYGKKKKCYTYQHPNPHLLDNLPFTCTNLTNIGQIYGLSDSVVFIDEASNKFDPMDKTINKYLRALLQVSRHNNLDVIFVAHNGYFINKSLFNFIDCVMFKKVLEHHFEFERPYMKKLYASKVIQLQDKEDTFIHNEDTMEFTKIKMPKWYSDTLSKSYSIKQKKKSIWEILGL